MTVSTFAPYEFVRTFQPLTQEEKAEILKTIKNLTNSGYHLQASELFNRYFPWV